MFTQLKTLLGNDATLKIEVKANGDQLSLIVSAAAPGSVVLPGLHLTGTAEELDAELPQVLGNYVVRVASITEQADAQISVAKQAADQLVLKEEAKVKQKTANPIDPSAGQGDDHDDEGHDAGGAAPGVVDNKLAACPLFA